MINKNEGYLEYLARVAIARLKAELRAMFIDGEYFEDTRPGDRLERIGIIGTRKRVSIIEKILAWNPCNPWVPECGGITVYYENWAV